MNPDGRRGAVRELLWSSLRGRRRELLSLAAWSNVEALPAFLSGRLVAQAVDDGFLAEAPETGFLWLGVLALSVVAGAWGTRQVFLRLAGIVEPFRDDLVTRVVTGSLRRSTRAGWSADSAGVARVTRQVEIAREAYASVLMVVQGFVVTTVSALLGLLTLAPELLVLVGPPLLLGLGLFVAALAGVAARQRSSILAEERIAETAGVVAGALRDVVAAGAEERIEASLGAPIEEQARATRRLARFAAIQTVTIAVGGWLPVVLILLAGPWLVGRGATAGTILGALTYVFGGLLPALESLVRRLGNTGLWLLVTLTRIVEASHEPEPPATDSPDGRVRPRPAGHEVTLRDVTFGYGRTAEPVIRDLSLVVPDGDHLAVVGPSGVGKSTLAGLIAGMLEPQAGEIRLGGVAVSELDGPAAALHRVLIPQEAYVFAGTLWENVTYLHQDATPEEIDRAVARLGAAPLAERLGGYAAEVHPPALSAGERQLITLVRAYVAPAPLVILDEATCHLDPAAEARVERAFAARPGTLIVIAHRISSAMRARRILVLDGTEVLIGGHEDLLERSPLYRDLVGRWEAGTVTVA